MCVPGAGQGQCWPWSEGWDVWELPCCRIRALVTFPEAQRQAAPVRMGSQGDTCIGLPSSGSTAPFAMVV